MRRKNVEIGKDYLAWTSMWGEFVLNVRAITPDKPARIQGVIVKIITQGYANRKLRIGQTAEVGIISIKPLPNQ